MTQASRSDGLSFDPFALLQDGQAAPAGDIGSSEVSQALVIVSMNVVIDRGFDGLIEITGQVVVFQQDAVRRSPGLMDAFSLMKESVFHAENKEPLLDGIQGPIGCSGASWAQC